jgi:Domain of unknown function (DUF4340)
MNAKTLYLLIAIAAAALIGAVAINMANRPTSNVSEQAKPLAAELKDHLNDVSAITLTGAGEKVLVTLKRDKEGWSVAERSGYPADVAKIREFLLKLVQATLIEQKTANPKHYADLGVDEVKDKDAKGILVEISGLAQPLRLIVGNYNGAGGGGTFVRRDGDAQSWLANGNLTIARNVGDWEKRDLTDIPASRLRSVTLTGRDGKVLKVAKEQATDANFKVADVPKGREASSEFVANSLASTLAGLKADDAFSAKDVAPTEKTIKAEYAAFDGVVVEVTGWDKDGKDYAQFAARLDADAANAEIDHSQAKAKAQYDVAAAAAESSKAAGDKTTADKTAETKAAESTAAPEVAKPLAVSDSAKDRQDRLDALNKEIADLNKAFVGWSFVLPSYKFADMSKTMDDMLKPLETKKPDAGKPGAKTPAKPVTSAQ